MALANLTKQLATQALGDQVNNVLDALRPGDPPKAGSAEPAVPAASLAATIVGEIQAMQKALKDDQELAVILNTGQETLRVLDIFLRSPQLLVLAGLDAERNVTRVIAPAESVQLVCKVLRVKPETKPVRVNILTPKA